MVRVLTIVAALSVLVACGSVQQGDADGGEVVDGARPDSGQTSDGAIVSDAAAPLCDSRVLFASERNGRGDVYVSRLDGGDQVPLTNTPDADEIAAVWSWDGSRIAYVRDFGIWTMDADGSHQVQLTEGFDVVPSWSPDGTLIAYMHAVPGGEGATDLWVMRADGSGAVNLTEDLDGNAGAASWSPDGTRLVAALGLYGAYDIYSMAPDGTDRVNLTSTPQQSEGDDESPPQWSPDGAQLLYVRPENGHKNIWVMNADGSEQRNLSHGGSHEEGARWAGDKIVFLRLPGFGGDLWSMNLDGSGQRNLTEDTTEDWAPVVSPDGRRLAWASYADGNREIYTMAVDGSERTRVTSTSASINDDRPAWEPCP